MTATLDTKTVEEYYREHYSRPSFQQGYLNRRDGLYLSIARILDDLRVKHALDIGCSYGRLVEILNEKGVDAYGADLPIDDLSRYHQTLKRSAGKFVYGNVGQLQLRISPCDSAVVILNTLMHVENPDALRRLTPEYFVIKEIGARSVAAKKRPSSAQLRFYSPLDCLNLLPGYVPWAIYATRFLFHVRRPHPIVLRLFDFLPSYTLVLRRAGGGQ